MARGSCAKREEETEEEVGRKCSRRERLDEERDTCRGGEVPSSARRVDDIDGEKNEEEEEEEEEEKKKRRRGGHRGKREDDFAYNEEEKAERG